MPKLKIKGTLIEELPKVDIEYRELENSKHEEAVKRVKEMRNTIILDKSMSIKFKHAPLNKEIINIFTNGVEIGQMLVEAKRKYLKRFLDDICYEIIGWEPHLYLLCKPNISSASLLKDKEFRKKWNRTKEKRAIEQKNLCLYCKQEFGKGRSCCLHHHATEQKIKDAVDKESKVFQEVLEKKISLEKAIKMYEQIWNNYIAYYKSLKDVDLICNQCHMREDGLN